VRRLKACLRAEEGVTLIELLIAMVVMAIGIAALDAGFSSGVLSINRAREASTAGTLADKQMELYRQAPFASLPIGLQSATTPTGPEGHTYWMQVDGAWTCAVGTYSAGSCSGTPASRPLKLLTITVRNGSPTAKLLFTQTATFDASTG
jgi:prepilin-type N-terminal cleavage/methylation domain-containing protein